MAFSGNPFGAVGNPYNTVNNQVLGAQHLPGVVSGSESASPVGCSQHMDSFGLTDSPFPASLEGMCAPGEPALQGYTNSVTAQAMIETLNGVSYGASEVPPPSFGSLPGGSMDMPSSPLLSGFFSNVPAASLTPMTSYNALPSTAFYSRFLEPFEASPAGGQSSAYSFGGLLPASLKSLSSVPGTTSFSARGYTPRYMEAINWAPLRNNWPYIQAAINGGLENRRNA